MEELKEFDSTYKTKMQLIYEEGKYIDRYDSINNGYNIENTIEKILSGQKVIMSKKVDHSYLTKLINNNGSTYVEEFIMIPNNIVQNIIVDGKENPSYIQLYGKRTVAYIMNMLKLRNINDDINFSIDMILWMNKLEGNNKREKKYFKDFLLNIHKNNLIDLNNNIDSELGYNDFMTGKLNIHEYNKNGEYINCFKLIFSEYDKIMNDYDGKLDKYNLLNLFCNIKSRIKKNNESVSFNERELEICFPSYETIMDDIFVESHKTLKKYIDALVELNLIRFGYSGDMIFYPENSPPIRRKANFIYVLVRPQWEEDLNDSISLYKSRKMTLGWKFLTEEKEILSNEKRSITQKINMLGKLSNQEKTNLICVSK